MSAFVFAPDLTAIDAVRLGMPTSVPPDAPPHVRQLAADLADARPMRRGSLSEHTIKCSKPGCACAKDPKACHGPYYSLTHAVRGKMHSRFLNIEQADLARQQIDAGREFRSRVDAYWEACETWADTQLDELTVSSEEAKRGLPANLQNEIVQEVEALLGRQAVQHLDFESLETAARRQALRLAALAVEQRLNVDTTDHAGPELPCACGGVAQYHGRHEKIFESVLGPLRLERAYYHCTKCQSGFCPRNRALRMELFLLTPAVLRMAGSAAAYSRLFPSPDDARYPCCSKAEHKISGWVNQLSCLGMTCEASGVWLCKKLGTNSIRPNKTLSPTKARIWLFPNIRLA